MNDEADAIVVGSGINGMVSAAELARAGWSVILLERNAEIGGFIGTEERTLPGYLHDTFSSWHPLFVSGPAYAALGELLHRHGLEYRNTDGWVTASVDDDGRHVRPPGPPTHSGGVRPRRGPVRLSHHAATTGREHGVNRRPARQRGAAPSRWRGTRAVWSAAAGFAAPSGGCAQRSPAAGRTCAGTSVGTRSTTCTRRGCCMRGSLRITPPAGS
jgi:phytoene dehydrogenase-like protein